MQHNSRLLEINWVTDSTSKSQRETLAKLDPENNALRWGATTHRRKYKVPWPNSLWHRDGHHSLIRWKLVIIIIIIFNISIALFTIKDQKRFT